MCCGAVFYSPYAHARYCSVRCQWSQRQSRPQVGVKNDKRTCAVCGGKLPGGRLRYCSDRCKERQKKRRQRRKKQHTSPEEV